jgi:hypothetical protein
LRDVISILDMFPNIEAAVFASHHSEDLKFFDTIKRYYHLRVKIVQRPIRFSVPGTLNLPDSDWDGVVIREAGDSCILNLGLNMFPKQVRVTEASLTSLIFNHTFSRVSSWNLSGLRKLQLLGRERRLHAKDWSEYRTHLHIFISRHPLLHTISFTPELNTNRNYVTGLNFPFLNDALCKLAAIHSISIKNLILVRDGVDNEWCIESIFIALESSVTTDNGTSKSVLDCLHTIMPTLKKVHAVIGGDRMHVSIVSPIAPCLFIVLILRIRRISVVSWLGSINSSCNYFSK